MLDKVFGILNLKNQIRYPSDVRTLILSNMSQVIPKIISVTVITFQTSTHDILDDLKKIRFGENMRTDENGEEGAGSGQFCDEVIYGCSLHILIIIRNE